MCAQPGFDAFVALRADIAAAKRTSGRPLVIGAGEGNTGTSTVAALLTRMGMRVLHFNDPAILRKLFNTEPSEYANIDFPSLFAPYDAVLDTPVPQLFPFILAAFPNARVVYSVRDPMEWVENRSRKHRGSARPGAALIERLASVPENAEWERTFFNLTASPRRVNPALGMSDMARRRLDGYAAAIAYSSQNLYYRCITRPSQYLLVNAFRGDLCRSDFVARLAFFVNRSAPRRGALGSTAPGCAVSAQ